MRIENSVYEKLSLHSISNNIFEGSEIDFSVTADNNGWIGLSLIAKIPLNISAKFERIIDKSKSVFGDQFYYEEKDLHVTILEIITCNKKHIISHSDLNEYISIIDKGIKEQNKFILKFSGIAISKSCVIAKGYSMNNTVNNIRKSLRVEFNNNQIFNSIDSRYIALAAHCTLVRFKNKLIKSQKYGVWVQDFNDFNFGECEVSELELRVGNWSLTNNKSKCIYTFNLNTT